MEWARPLLDAFRAGCWYLYWTDETLYWVAKPTLHKDPTPNTRRLHRADGPALESDGENVYFWHGVLVPAFVILRPEEITVQHILYESNMVVRRVLLTRFGEGRFLTESGALPLDATDRGTLYRYELPGDEPLVMIRVLNSTEEPDQTRNAYLLRVPPTITRVQDALAWGFALPAAAYAPVIET